MLNTRCQPTFVLLSIRKTRLTISQAGTTSATILAFFGNPFGHPFEHLKFATEQLSVLIDGTEANILVTCINTQIHRLSVSTRTVNKLNCERVTPDNFGFATFEQEPRFSWSCGHQRTPVLVNNVNFHLIKPSEQVFVLQRGFLRQCLPRF